MFIKIGCYIGLRINLTFQKGTFWFEIYSSHLYSKNSKIIVLKQNKNVQKNTNLLENAPKDDQNTLKRFLDSGKKIKENNQNYQTNDSLTIKQPNGMKT